MAKKKGQLSGGDEGTINTPGGSERERFLEDIKLATEGAFACLEKIRRLPAGPERDDVVRNAEIILHDAEKTATNIIGADIASAVIVGALKTTRKEFNTIKRNLVTAGALGIHAAEKADAEEKVRKAGEEKELAEMQRQEDAERLLREADERVGRGEGTDEDHRVIAEELARRVEKEQVSVRAFFDDTRPALKAAREAIKSNDVDLANEQVEWLEEKLASLLSDYKKNADAAAQQGFDPDQHEVLKFYHGRIRDFEREVVVLREHIAAHQAEHEAAEQESAKREEIGQRFSARITELGEQARSVLALPLGDAAEIEAARVSLNDLERAVLAHFRAWDAEVKPILQGMRGLNGDWEDLVHRQRALRELGHDARRRKEMLQEKMGEGAKEKWETELPLFEIDVMNVEMRVLDARLLQGSMRKERFEAIHEAMPALRERWNALRKFAPPLSREQIDAGERTARAVFDGRVTGLEERVTGYLHGADAALPTRLDEIARLWRNALVRTHQLWNPDTDIGVRGVFLDERYGPEEVKGDDPEFVALVSEQHRGDFEKLANGDVFKILRRRGAQTKEQQAQEEQAAREGLDPTIPQLSLDRLLEDDAYTNFFSGKFWKNARASIAFQRAFSPDAVVSDEQAQKYVTDVPAFRFALAALVEARARVVATEDILIGKTSNTQQLEGTRSVEGVRAAYDAYAMWREKAKEAFGVAIDAEGWTIPKRLRKSKLYEFFAGYRQLGPAVIRDVPRELRDVVRAWAIAERHVRMYGRYTQWLLHENPDIAREMGPTLPKEFIVPRPRKQRTEHDDAVAGGISESDEPGRVFTAQEKEMFQIPVVADERVGEDYAGEVLDTGAFSGDGGAMSFSGNDTEEDTDPASVPENIPAYSAVGDAPRTPEAIPVMDERARLLKDNHSWKSIKSLLADDIFWAAEPGTRGTMLAAYRRNGTMNTNRLREDRVADFEYAIAFTDIADLERRVGEVRAKYAEVVPVKAPVVASTESISPSPASSVADAPTFTPRDRRIPTVPTDVPRPPRPDVETPRVESAPARAIPVPANISNDPFARFFGNGSESPAVEARPVVRSKPVVKPVVLAPARIEIPIEAPVETPAVEAPRETHAEDNVSSWSRSLRNTVGRFFGNAPQSSEVVPSVRAAQSESLPPAEASRRTAGGLMSVLGRFFGPKVFANVPRYLPESFGDQNARALLEASILDAMEENTVNMKNVAGDPDRIRAANLDAAARLDRAIATSTTRNGEPLPDEEKARLRGAVSALSEKYTQRTRENAVAQSRELAGIIEQSVRVLETPGRRGSLALRLLSKLPFNIGTNLAYGVGDFRKRFEGVVSRGSDVGLVARVATVFRETWEEAMQGIRASGSLSSRAMNTAEAVAMISTAYGLNATVTALEQILPSLRSLSGSERDAMSRLAAEGRLQAQATADRVLPVAEQAIKRAV